jgi:hypothetical protein
MSTRFELLIDSAILGAPRSRHIAATRSFGRRTPRGRAVADLISVQALAASKLLQIWHAFCIGPTVQLRL